MLHVFSGVHRSEILVRLAEQLEQAVLVLTKVRYRMPLDYNILLLPLAHQGSAFH